jgi:hypothetical protein
MPMGRLTSAPLQRPTPLPQGSHEMGVCLKRQLSRTSVTSTIGPQGIDINSCKLGIRSDLDTTHGIMTFSCLRSLSRDFYHSSMTCYVDH